MSVSIRPGETAFTRTPSVATSRASPSVKASIAAFEAAYQTNSPGEPMVAAAEDRFTMAPPPPPFFVDMRLIASRATRIAPVTLRSMTLRMVAASAASRRLERPTMPALLTRWVSRPSFSSISA